MGNEKILFLILDGAADEGKSTPLMTAKMPNLDLLSRNSFCGMWEGPRAPAGYNVRSLSEMGTLQLLGYSAEETAGRGFLESLGLGIKADKRAVYVRTNFATVDKNLKIIDRRAGRDERGLDELSKLLNMKIDDVQIKFFRGPGHRGVLMLKPLKGKLDPSVGDSDVGMDSPQKIRPVKFNTASKRTADLLNEFSIEAHKRLSASTANSFRKLPANYVLLRGAGQYRKIEPFARRWRMKACCIAASNIVRGIAYYMGMDVIDVKGATGKADTDLDAKIKAALDALRPYDFVVLHIKGTDSAAHAKDAKLKRTFLERIDREVGSWLLHLRNIDVVVATDHITSSRTGEHIFGPVPFLIYQSGVTSNRIGRFDECHCSTGLMVHNPMERLLLRLRHRHEERREE